MSSTTPKNTEHTPDKSSGNQACVLLLDLGNTRLKLGLWQAASPEVKLLTAISHADLNEMQQTLTQALHDLNLPEGHAPSIALGTSVACEDRMKAIAQTLAAHPHPIATEWVWPHTHAFGVTNAYPQPRALGADRWSGILGLSRHHTDPSRSAILANFGTATTIDTLSADKVFMGGLILPGITMMQDALLQGTARLPLARGQVMAYPTDTHAAITTGIVAAQIGAIMRQCELSHARDGVAPQVYASGGAWQTLAPEWHRMVPDIAVHPLPNVVLDGLSLFAQASRDG